MHLQRVIKIFVLFCALLTTSINNAQNVRVVDNKGTVAIVHNNQVTLSATEPSNPGEGDIWIDSSSTPNTFNVWDGNQWTILPSPFKKVTNELFFEGNLHYYVSLLITPNDWEVTRYTKDNINEEGKAIGTGTQPDDLITVESLTYN